MKKAQLNNQGFGLLGVLVIIAVVGIAGVSGWLVWHKSHDTKKAASTNTGMSSKDKNGNAGAATDPYKGWLSFSNTTYGVTFKYPSNWKTDEGAAGSADSATKQEYAINLKRNEDVKYNDTATLEVLGEDMSTAAAWYDSYFAQSAENHVTKISSTLKGKSAISYSVMNSGTKTKLYLLSVGSKTYAFSSINESSNVEADSSYWTNFDKVFDSLQVD